MVLRDAQTGQILATGVTQGGTGDTALIMHENRGSRAVLSDDSAAKFTTTLDLDEPRLIEAEAYGPLGEPQAATRVLATQWVVPRKRYAWGRGADSPGLVVDGLHLPAHIRVSPDADSVDVRANVAAHVADAPSSRAACGMPSSEVMAIVRRNGAQGGSPKLPSLMRARPASSRPRRPQKSPAFTR